jgi:pimeloyl-ACP methyl ester carboxylesterase
VASVTTVGGGALGLGAALAWLLASLVLDKVDHLVVLCVGHPATFRDSYQQLEKSWYMLLFQFPQIAEQWLAGNNWAHFRSWARHPMRRR